MKWGTAANEARTATFVATGALAGCVILQIWALLCEVRQHLGTSQSHRPVELWVTALYLAFVILFGWCAARGHSRAYRNTARTAAAVQMAAAAICAALVFVQPQAGGAELARVGVALLLLPLNGMQYLREGVAAPFLCLAVFFAMVLVLTCLPVRERRTAHPGERDMSWKPAQR